MDDRRVLVAERPPGEVKAVRGGVPALVAARYAAVGGVLFFVLFLVFATLTSNSPSVSDTRQEIFTYLTDHHDRLQFAAVALGLAMPAALLMLSGLFRALRRAEGTTPGLAVAALGGGTLAAAGSAVGALLLGTTANRVADLNPAGARVAWTLFELSLGMTLLGLLLLVGSTAVVSLHTRLFPRWFTAASVLLAIASVIGACAIGYATTGIAVVAGLAVVFDSVWILLVSVYLWRGRTVTLP